MHGSAMIPMHSSPEVSFSLAVSRQAVIFCASAGFGPADACPSNKIADATRAAADPWKRTFILENLQTSRDLQQDIDQPVRRIDHDIVAGIGLERPPRRVRLAGRIGLVERRLRISG